MWRDIRVACRFLIKRRTATAVTILTLGIAISVCTLALGALDEAFWRSLRSAEGTALVTFYNTRASVPQFQTLSHSEYTDLRDQLRNDVDVAAFFRTENTIGGGSWPVRVRGELVSSNYFRVLGAKPFAGEWLTVDDTHVPSPSIVLSYDFWLGRFGANPAVIGTPIRVGQGDYRVLGIAAPGFHGPAYPSDFWIPLTMTEAVVGEDLAQSRTPYLQTVARPRAGVTLDQIRGRVQAFVPYASKEGWRLGAFPGFYLKFWPAYRSAIGRFLGVFVGLALGILIIACVNVASLLLVRAGERQRELAIRQALGGTRLQLFRRLAAKSIVLTVAGGIAGLVLAFWGSAWVQRIPVPVPAPLGVTFDARLGAIAVAVSLVASLLFTTLSAWKGLRSNMQTVLSSCAGTLTHKPNAQRVLVIAQVALSCVMLIAGGLLLRSLLNVNRIDVGFNPANRLTAMVGLSDQGYTPASGRLFYQRLQDSLEHRVQVHAIAFEWNALLAPMRSTNKFLIPQRPEPLQARYNVVSAGYFKTLDIAVRAGREFDRQDGQTTEPVAIVNETLAALFVGSPVGQTLRKPDGTSPRRIVGVVRDTKYNGITEPSQPFVYMPFAQVFRQDMHVYLDLRTSTAEGLELLRTELRALDPNVSLSDVRTLTAQLDGARAVPRASAVVSGALSGIAVFLALVGIYGVMTTSIEHRKRELAIRSALGAAPPDIIKRVVLEGAVLTAIGLAVGLIASLATGRFVSGLLFGVEAHDVIVFLSVPALILAGSAAAWVGPACRAARVDPVIVLRSE